MSELVCGKCYTTYRSIGHFCLNGIWIPEIAKTNITVQAIEDELESFMQETSRAPTVEIDETKSVVTKAVNPIPEFCDENYLSNQVAFRNKESAYSSEDLAAVGASMNLMTIHSEQGNVGECVKKSVNREASFRRDEICTIDRNMAMRHDFSNTEMPSNVVEVTRMIGQLGLDKQEMHLPFIPNSSSDSPTVNGTINQVTTCGFSSLDFFEDQLERHSVAHSKKTSFVCNVCQRSFNQKCFLNKHRLSHSGIKSHKCGECGKAFCRGDKLKVHMRIHTGERPFTCDTCGKTFSQSGGLKKHTLLHTGVKPFTCDICGKAFSQSSNLKSHAVIHERKKQLKIIHSNSSFNFFK